MSSAFAFPVDYIADPEKFGAVGLGELYIGVVDGDPANNPADRIQVYLARQNDADLPIPQPIMLSAGGVPIYNGSPATIRVDSEYSCAILNWLGSQIYYCARAGWDRTEINELNEHVATLQIQMVTRTQFIAKIADLAGLTPENGQVFSVSRFHADFCGVGGALTYNAARPRADHDGGTVIDSSKVFPATWDNTTIAAWYTADGTGNGCYERTFSGASHIDWFGAKADWNGASGTDNSLVIEQAAKKYGDVDMRSAGKYYCATAIGLGDRDNYIAGQPLTLSGGHLVLNTPGGLFTSAAAKLNPEANLDIYSGVINFTGITFTQSAASKVFDGDRLYNCFISKCRFVGINRVSRAYRAKPSYPNGYSQSMNFNDNWFVSCGANADNLMIDHSLSFDFTFRDNKMDGCHGGIRTIAICARIEGNLHQSGGRFLTLEASRGTIKDNYLESNRFGALLTDTSPAEIVITESVSNVFPAGIEVSGNNFQPNSAIAANPNYSVIRLPSTSIGGANGWWGVDVCNNQIDGSESAVSLVRVVAGGLRNYGGNSFKPLDATESLNSAFAVAAGMKYSKSYNTSCAASSTTNLVFTLASGGAGDLEFKVNVFTAASAPGGVKRFRVSGNISTGNYQAIELTGDTYTSGAVTFGAISAVSNVITLPVNILIANGYTAYIDVNGFYRGGSAGFDSKTADVCVITKT